ncbi:hypothetical protein [Streptomyces sp. NRRL S-920]|uniref:hypothetical protein n=1 Tax=Streptomyces sp. NRRL S-920 TaxID=1463921 RepID=UPI0004C77D96|nr:hypothetical protein [Streptomyces sp. NRRL S-920]
MRDEYKYNAGGTGVHEGLVQAVLEAWSRVSPTGEPSTLRSVGDGYMNSVDNIARIAAVAVAEAIDYLEDR